MYGPKFLPFVFRSELQISKLRKTLLFLAFLACAGSPSLSTAATLTANTSNLNFGDVLVGGSKSLSVVVTNSSSSSVVLTSQTASSVDYAFTGISFPLTLGAKKSATLTVKYSPHSNGYRLGSLTLKTNSSSTSLALPIVGTGVAASIVPTPASASFGQVTVGTTNSQTIQIKNTGSSSIVIAGANSSGAGFSTSGLSSPRSLSPGSSLTFNVVFSPTSSSSASGTITIPTSVAGLTLNIPASGNGGTATKQLSISPGSIDFGNVALGSSASTSVSLKNSGNATITVSQASITGTGLQVSGLAAGTNIAPGQSASLQVSFAPKTAGSVQGTLKISSNSTNSPSTISISGGAVTTTVHSVDLDWNASTSSQIAGYNIYRGTASGGPYSKIGASASSQTQYTDRTPSSGKTYYYVVTTLNSSGLESSYSNQVTAKIPSN